MIFFPHTSV